MSSTDQPIAENKQVKELLALLQKNKTPGYKGLASLPEKQARRIYAHFFLGMSQRAIARAEGCNKSSVADSINSGLSRLKKFFEENLL